MGSTSDTVRRAWRLRVLMIAPTSFFANYGCHVRILEETRALQQAGHAVTICTYPNGADVRGLTIRRALGPPGPRRAVVGSSRHKLYLDAALSLRTVVTALATRPDLIHAHLHEGALIGSALARLLRRPLLFDYQGSLTAEMIDHGFLRDSGIFYRPTRALERRANRAADLVVTSTGNAARLLQKEFGLPSTRVRTVADGVNTRRFRPDPFTEDERAARRARYGIGPERKVVVYLGLLAPHQGTGVLLEAARRVVEREPRAFFLLGGFPGNETYRLQAEALGLGAHTSFPGCIPYERAEEFLALGDIAVSAKLAATEGNGKLYNYMAMGLATIASDTAANREILGDTGLFAARGDAGALAERILELLARPEEAAARGRALRARAVDQLSWQARATELLAVYDDVLAAHHAGRALPAAGLTPAATSKTTPAYQPAVPPASEADD